MQKCLRNQESSFFQTVSFVVRKTGHFGEYGILGALWILLLLSFEKIRNIKKRIIWLTAMEFVWFMQFLMRYIRDLWTEEPQRCWM